MWPPVSAHRNPLPSRLSPPLVSGGTRRFSLPLSPSLSLQLSRVSCGMHPRTSVPLRAFLRDAGAVAVVTASAYSLVRCFDILTERNVIGQKLSRKLVHILSGLLFMASWSIFSDSGEARYFAAFVPFLNLVRLVVYGLSFVADEGLVKSLTREGKREELLKGPLYYVSALMLCALAFWRNSPVGVVSLSMMCAGDGFADIMGRNFGSVKLPYNEQKSWVGSISMFLFGFSVSMLMLYFFSVLGYFQLEWGVAAVKVAAVALIATLAESLPVAKIVDDNLSVPLTSMLAMSLFFGQSPRH